MSFQSTPDTPRVPTTQRKMRGAFGPFYPAPLQSAVNHAERLSHMLSVERIAHEAVDEWGMAWLTGRDGEIERFVELVTDAWRCHEIDVTGAAAVIEAYLGALHDGLERHFRMRRSPCCGGALASTVLPVPSDAFTREYPAQRKARCLGDTGISIEALLAGIVESSDGDAT